MRKESFFWDTIDLVSSKIEKEKIEIPFERCGLENFSRFWEKEFVFTRRRSRVISNGVYRSNRSYRTLAATTMTIIKNYDLFREEQRFEVFREK